MLKPFKRSYVEQQPWLPIEYHSWDEDRDLPDQRYLRYMNCQRLEENCLVMLLLAKRLKDAGQNDYRLATRLAIKYRQVMKEIGIKWSWSICFDARENEAPTFFSFLLDCYGKGERMTNGSKCTTDEVWMREGVEHAEKHRPKLVKAARADIDELIVRMLERRKRAVEMYELVKENQDNTIEYDHIGFHFERTFEAELDLLKGVQGRRLNYRQPTPVGQIVSKRQKRSEENKRKHLEERTKKGWVGPNG